MTEQSTKETRRREAYEALEQAIRTVAEIEEYEGLLTDWVILAAIQRFDEDGEALTAVTKFTPWPPRIPYYRVMGLIDFAHAGMHNDIHDEPATDPED